MPLPPPFIVCAAIKIKDLIICGPRHGDCINTAIAVGVYPNGEDQTEEESKVILGFVDQEQEFYTREEAWVIADKMGEIRRPTGWEADFSKTRPPNVGDKKLLFSENLF